MFVNIHGKFLGKDDIQTRLKSKVFSLERLYTLDKVFGSCLALKGKGISVMGELEREGLIRG